MKTDARQQAISMLAVYAVKYSLTTRTFAVPETCAAIKSLADELSSFGINQIVGHIEEALDGDEDLAFEEASEWMGLLDRLHGHAH